MQENTQLQTQPQQGSAISVLSTSNLKQTMAAANELKQFVTDQKLASNIQGKTYVHVEGWQFAGAMLGIFAISEGSDCQNYKDETTGKFYYRYKAYVALYNSEGRKVGGASGLCSNAEPNKAKYEEYAIESSAQTRATSKAFRVMLGWMMKAAGYEATPFEEMEGVSGVTEMVTDEQYIELGRLLQEVSELELLPAAERKQLGEFTQRFKDTPADDMPARDAKKLIKILLEWQEKYKEVEF